MNKKEYKFIKIKKVSGSIGAIIENIKLLIENTEVNLQNIFGDSIIHQLLKKNLFIQYSKYLENKEINIFKDSSSSTLNTINENSDYFKRKKKFLSLFLLGNKFFLY